MRTLKLVLSLAFVCLVAAACASDNEDSAPSSAATAQPTEAPAPEPADPPSAARAGLADAMFSAIMADPERPGAIGEDQVRCLADGLASAFSDERLDELGLNAASVASVYGERGAFALGDAYQINDGEVSDLVDKALECLDWRAFVAGTIADEGISREQADCVASQMSEEGIRSVVMGALIFSSDDSLGADESEMREVFRGCMGDREIFFDLLVAQGISEESARCVVEGVSEEALSALLSGEVGSDEEAGQLFSELFRVQNRCLTPEELESMNGLGTP